MFYSVLTFLILTMIANSHMNSFHDRAQFIQKVLKVFLLT